MISVPEIVVVLVVTLLSLVPLAILVWILVRVLRMRNHQESLEARIEALERGGRERR